MDNAPYFVVKEYYNKNVKELEEAEEGELLVRKFQTEAARVRVEFGVTVNMGNFNMCKVNVGLTLPCYVEEVDAAYEQAKRWAEERMETEVNAIKKERRR